MVCTYCIYNFLDQPFKGNLDEDVRAEMIKFTCVKPVERFRTIDDSFRNFFQYDKNEHLKSISMNIDINTKVKLECKNRVQSFIVYSLFYLTLYVNEP